MNTLVADIGGTNSRLALADGAGVRAATVRRYCNRDFTSFEQVFRRFMAEHNAPRLDAAAVAVAGPVAAGRATLTNLGWQVDAALLSALLDGGRAVLVNDLVALGYAVAALPASAMRAVRAPSAGRIANGQALIVGIGTGLNASAMRAAGGSVPVCFEAEIGHAALPAPVAALAHRYLGGAADTFVKSEDCLSGRGLSRIYALLAGAAPENGARIVERAAEGNAAAATALEVFAALTGAFCHEMLFQYLPLDGIYLAGSVARGVFAGGLNAAFDAAFLAPTPFGAAFANVPVTLIDDDAAALSGCVAALATRADMTGL